MSAKIYDLPPPCPIRDVEALEFRSMISRMEQRKPSIDSMALGIVIGCVVTNVLILGFLIWSGL